LKERRPGRVLVDDEKGNPRCSPVAHLVPKGAQELRNSRLGKELRHELVAVVLRHPLTEVAADEQAVERREVLKGGARL
jgi:hypothetical protein